MFVRQSSFLAVLALMAVAGPLCGVFAAVACDVDCCCGVSRLADHCEEGVCLESQPAAMTAVAVVTPVAAAIDVADAGDGFERIDRSAAESTSWTEPLEHSPPDLYLQNGLLLI